MYSENSLICGWLDILWNVKIFVHTPVAAIPIGAAATTNAVLPAAVSAASIAAVRMCPSRRTLRRHRHSRRHS